jgi:hypothetical protein
LRGGRKADAAIFVTDTFSEKERFVGKKKAGRITLPAFLLLMMSVNPGP